MWRYGIVQLAILFFIGSAFSNQLKLSDQAFSLQVLKEINAYRTAHHLSPLTLDKRASRIAQMHSTEMAKQRGINHTGFKERVKQLCSSVSKCNGAAENVAYYPLDAKKLVAGWLASPGHRENIQGQYTITGFGLAETKPGWAYYTQIFLKADK